MSLTYATRRTLLKGGGVWSPTQLGAALVGWWDASDASTITLNGSTVAAWASKAGGITATQGTAANQPTYSSAARNGTPGLVFDGTNTWLQFTSTSMPVTNMSAMVSAYLNSSQGSFYRRVFTYGGVDNARPLAIMRRGDTQKAGELNLGSASMDWAGSDLELYVEKTGLSSAMYVNGVQQGSIAPWSGDLSNTLGFIGKGNQYPDTWTGVIQQIVVTNRALSTVERQKLEGWESWYTGKAGANLPTNHPYRYRRP